MLHATWSLLLLLSAQAFTKTAAGPFDNSYIINPASYLDVIRPQQSNPTETAGTQLAQSSNSSTAQQTSDVGRGRHLLQAMQNPTRLQKPFNVCVSAWAPMVQCDPESDPSGYKGYQIELFRMLAKEVGWADDDYVFTCMEYSAMMEDLKDPAGNCSLSASGVEVVPEYLAAGLKFSWPTYKSGLRVMIYAVLQTGSTWAFSEPFAWQVWILLAATTIAIGLVVALMEWLNGKYTRSGEWQSWEWYSLSKLAHVTPHVGDPGSDASRVLVLGYGFLVLVMISMYTAMAASRITAAALVHPVHSEHDLAGPDSPYKTVTWDKYVSSLDKHHHIHAVGKSWSGEADLSAMVAGLRDGTYTALIMDAHVLEFTVGTNEACDLFLVGGDVFESFSLALAFPPAFSDALVFDFSRSMIKLQTFQGAMDMLENVYIKTGGTAKCFGSASAGSHGSGETIELYQVSGLWYILLITIAVCFVLTLAHNMRKDPNKVARFKRLRSAFWSSGGQHGAGGGHGHDGHGSGRFSAAGHNQHQGQHQGGSFLHSTSLAAAGRAPGGASMAAAAGATAVYNAAAQQQSVDVDDKGAASGQRQMAKQGSMEALRAHWGHGAATTKASFEQFLAGQPQPVSLGQEAAGLSEAGTAVHPGAASKPAEAKWSEMGGSVPTQNH